MRRRDFITLIGSTTMWPLAAYAQQPTVPVIGYLYAGSLDVEGRAAATLERFRKALGEAGYVEGRNVAIEYRWAENRYERLPELAADLVRRPADVIVTIGALPATLAARAATRTIPIVFDIGGDPVRLGLVASLTRPGGNLTGATNLNTEVLPKRLELLHTLVPAASKVALLVNPTNPAAEAQSAEVRAATRTLGLQLDVLQASTEREIEAAFASVPRLGAGGVVIAGDGLFVDSSAQLGKLSLKYAVPAIFQFREFAAGGGLMSYGSFSGGAASVAGTYTGRILKGEKPADLPVQQATSVELIINIKTAKALGVTVPLALLTRADEVIE